MQARRNNALASLRRLAESIKYCKIILPDRTLEEELDQTCIWANNDGIKSSLSEINKRMDDMKLKAREQYTLFCLSMPVTHLAFLYF